MVVCGSDEAMAWSRCDWYVCLYSPGGRLLSYRWKSCKRHHNWWTETRFSGISWPLCKLCFAKTLHSYCNPSFALQFKFRMYFLADDFTKPCISNASLSFSLWGLMMHHILCCCMPVAWCHALGPHRGHFLRRPLKYECAICSRRLTRKSSSCRKVSASPSLPGITARRIQSKPQVKH